MIKKIKYCILSFFLFTGSLLAQDIPDSVVLLHMVKVTAFRPLQESGLVKTNIDSTVLQENTEGSLSNILSNHSTVFIKSYGEGSLSSASFRGTAASHTRVEWNGITLNNPMIGQVDFSMIPVYFVDKMELFHGGSSLHSGSGALGGSIVIESKPEYGKELYASLSQNHGSFNTNQTMIKIGGGNDKIQLKGRLFYKSSDNDFEFLNTANGIWGIDKQLNADYIKQGATLEAFLKPSKNNLISINSWIQNSERNLPPIMSYQGEGRDEIQKDDEIRVSGKWLKFSDKIQSIFTTGFAHSTLDYYLANHTPGGLLVNYDSRSEVSSYFNKYLFQRNFNYKTIVRALFNYNYHQVSVFEDIELKGYDAERNELGGSLSVHHNFKGPFEGYLLIRQDHIGGEFSPIMPAAGIEYFPLKTSRLIIRSNVSKNYHQPSLNDMYWVPGGNPDLLPEDGFSYDISAEFNKNNYSNLSISSEITAYLSKINDWIIWVPGEFRYWHAENIQEVFSRGIEYKFLMSRKYTDIKWNINSNYSLTKTTQESNSAGPTGNQLIYIPVHKANFMAYVEYKKFHFSYYWNFTGERFTTSSNEETRHSLPWFQLHGVGLGKKVAFSEYCVQISFKVNNLFDTAYQTILWRAMPGRNYMVSIRFDFNRKKK